jgi:EpsI family protein
VLRFLNSGAARLVTLLLVAQAALLYSSIRPEAVPAGKPFAEFPQTIGPWHMAQEGVLTQEEQDVLKADDYVIRSYVDPQQARGASLYIAAFRSQRSGKAPHSPKNCLPGSGWTQLSSSEITIDPGMGEPIPVNRYVVTHGEERSLVLYWYQSRDRAVADEFKAKFWVVADAIRLNRTDSALIRVIVRINNDDDAGAEKTAVDFIRSVFPDIRAFLPA